MGSSEYSDLGRRSIRAHPIALTVQTLAEDPFEPTPIPLNVQILAGDPFEPALIAPESARTFKMSYGH